MRGKKRQRSNVKDVRSAKKKKVEASEEKIPLICDTPTTSSSSTLLTPTVLFSKKESKYANYMRYEKSGDMKVGFCLLCEQKYGPNTKRIPMKKSNTAGVKNHFSRDHPTQYGLLFGQPSRQSTLQSFLSSDAKVLEELDDDIERSTVCWIALKNLPLSFFDDQETQNFFHLLNDELEFPRRNKLGDQVLSHFKEMQVNFKTILNNIASKMAFTIDAWWSLSKVSYYATTVHFIDDDWNLISTVLDLLPSEGKHAGQDIADIFFEALESFEITQKLNGKII